ncbi:MAG: acylphosphatase [Rhizobiales bacterium]|nr:acylphosphatase [Hyphomicrobiales bacterium]
MVVHLIISGRVQGVGYRQWLSRHAGARGLQGWVRNRSDRTVEAVLAGDEADVEATINEAMNGPLGAKVDRIDRREAEGEEFAPGFEIRPTV